LQRAKSCNEVGPDEERAARGLGGEAVEALLRGRVAVDPDQGPFRAEALGDQPRVAAGAEGAVDRGLARLGSEDGSVFAGHELERRRPGRRLVGEGGSAGGMESHGYAATPPARPSAISGAAASSSSSCLAQASAFQISRYSPAPMTTHSPSSPACSISGLGIR